MGFRGTGGPQPTANNTFGQKFKQPENVLSEKVGDTEKKVNPFRVGLDKEVTVVTLDPLGLDYSVRLHTGFKLNGNYNNNVVCLSGSGPCPLCDALGQKGKWFAAGTVLDGSEWTIPDGKNKGRVIKDQRRLLLVNAKQLDAMKRLEKRVTWRGQEFSVSRGTDQKSSKIGEQWLPSGAALTEAQLLERFAGAAKDYGMPVEEYIKPFNYDVVLKPLSLEKVKSIADMFKSENAALSGIEQAKSENDIPF